MKEKNKIRLIQALCIIAVLITIFCIQRTYAKYFEKINTTYDATIKKWVINVNEKNIHNEETLTNVMTPRFFYDENMNTNDTLVPGRYGCFDFLIDYTNVDVNFKFEFDIKQTGEKKLTDFEVYGYKIVSPDLNIAETTTIDDIGEITPIPQVDGKYDFSVINQTIIPSSYIVKKRRILVVFKWLDSAENTMNNSADTKIAGTNLNYTVKIKFTQKV